jgi:hypothetical protein
MVFSVSKSPSASRVLKPKEGESFGMLEFDPCCMTEAIRHLVRGIKKSFSNNLDEAFR